MAINPSETDYTLVQRRTRNSLIKVELLNFQMQTVDFFEGRLTDGSINIDSDSDIRRTCSITLTLNDNNTYIQEGGEIWLDKFIRIYEGSYDIVSGENIWWNMGLFIINNPNRVYNSTTNSLTFEGLDLMAKLTDKRNGQLPALTTEIPAESSIADVVKNIIVGLAGFNNYVVVDKGYTIPYDIKKDSGSTIYELLAEIRDLYANWEMFFDVDGVFHWQPIPNGKNDPVVLDFDQLDQPLIISDSIDIDFENVKNNIYVWGRLLDDGTQIYAQVGDYIENSPFNINKIGAINYIINDEKIYTNELALERANYELYLHSRLNDNIILETIPIYWLNDVNVKIKYTNSKIGIDGDYLIKSLSIPLGINSTMSITAMKIYYGEETPIAATAEYPVANDWNTSQENQIPYYKEMEAN